MSNNNSDAILSSRLTATFNETPLKLWKHPDKGRFVIAARDIKAGEVVFEEEAQFYGLTPRYSKSICDYCCKISPDFPNTYSFFCSSCDLFFCSEECQKMAQKTYHIYECEFLKCLKNEWDNEKEKDDQEFENLIEITRLMIIFCLKESPHLFFEPEAKKFLEKKLSLNEFQELTFHKEERNEISEKAADIIHKSALKANSKMKFKNIPKKKTLISWILRSYTNRYSLYFNPKIYISKIDGYENSEDLIFGEGVFPFSSFFNHSCTPNLAKIRNLRTIKFIAMFDIPKGAELNHTYISGGLSYRKRQATLQNDWGFKCTCPGCKDDEYYEKFIDYFLCRDISEDCFGWFSLWNIEKNEQSKDEEKFCSFSNHLQKLYLDDEDLLDIKFDKYE